MRFYGTTYSGGTFNFGTVFKVTPAGVLTTLHNFSGAPNDGEYPTAPLTQGPDGYLYGTTSNSAGTTNSTFFKITRAGALTNLYTFDAGDFGAIGLVLGSDGNFYGACASGGVGSIVFQITPGGAFAMLHTFDIGGVSGIVQGTNGVLYGTTFSAGASQLGSVFSLSMGLRPFVTTLPGAAKQGAFIRILGTDLTGANGVTFGGIPAGFTVASASEIVAKVPAGAATGKVLVTTTQATLSTKLSFPVVP